MKNNTLAAMFVDFLADVAYQKLTPTISPVGSQFNVQGSWATVRNYRLYAGLVKLSEQGPLVFRVGLPSMPHDYGLPITGIVIYPTKVVILLQESNRMHKKGKKKNRAYEALKSHPDLHHFSSFKVPVKFEFEREWWESRRYE